MKASSFKFIIQSGKRDREGLCPVYLRITAYYSVKHLYTRLKIQPRHWNKKKGTVRESHPDHLRLNQFLEDFLFKAKENYKFEMKPKRIKEQTLTGFINQTIHSYLENGQLGAAEKMKNLRNKLILFCGYNLPLHKVDKQFILAFEAHLKQIGNRTNTIANNLSDLRTVMNRASGEGLILGDSPFKGVKIKTEKTERRVLSKSEIDRLVNLRQESLALDLFLFSFFGGGIRFSDLVTLTWDSVNGDSLKFRMRKTNKPFTIPLLPEAQAILNKYQFRMVGHTWVFPVLPEGVTDRKEIRRLITSKNWSLNRELKRIAKELGIEPFSFHCARHSVANYLLQKGTSIYTISKLLRHSNLAVTERYLADFDQELVNREFENAFN